MKIIKTVQAWRAEQVKFKNQSIGFVPTMGHLHAGHMSLIEKSLHNNNITVVSIFVNPTQFNNQEDLDHYPITLEQDIELLKAHKVDYLFCPDYSELYPDDYTYNVSEKKLSRILEGEHRPGHFDGVLTVVLKLLNIIEPDNIYMGEKDYQQAELIKQMTMAFFMRTNVEICTTARQKDGLALSSRNSHLTKQQLEQASVMHKLINSHLTLTEIKTELVASGFKVDYVEDYNNRRFAAAWLGKVRLIDNVKKSHSK